MEDSAPPRDRSIEVLALAIRQPVQRSCDGTRQSVSGMTPIPLLGIAGRRRSIADALAVSGPAIA